MFTESDYKLLQLKNITTETVLNQLASFSKGFPYARLHKPAIVSDGINRLSDEDCSKLLEQYDKAVSDGADVAKFVPSSGAATRMFKSLFEFLQASPEQQEELIQKEPYTSFLDNLDRFAFSDDLQLSELNKSDKVSLCKAAISQLLLDDGLGYGSLPKGLLKFHTARSGGITPFEEHLRETAKYCKTNSGAGVVHFTVSPEHHPKFVELMIAVVKDYESEYGITFNIDFSFQKPSTDTIAANPDNTPFRDEEGKLLFRPGGHGALIENLNDLPNELVFIKNIDNVVPDHLQADTVKYKKVLAGLLLKKKDQVFNILHSMDSTDNDSVGAAIDKGFEFLKNELQLEIPTSVTGSVTTDQVKFIKDKLNRPIRVCGMVKNEGEPGGGPFWVEQSDNSISLQIVEGAQVDPNSSQQQVILGQSTHFNPVDLVCYLKDYKGQKFDLRAFVDPNTGFISEKTQNGKPLKALELPGLWNGAMANWLTFFVEVPITTFNPVKTVIDLLRPQHQPL